MQIKMSDEIIVRIYMEKSWFVDSNETNAVALPKIKIKTKPKRIVRYFWTDTVKRASIYRNGKFDR